MSKLKCDKLHRINNNHENVRKINSSMSIVYSTIRKNIYYIKEGTKFYYSLVKILLITFFICIFTRSNHGHFCETFKNKPNIKSICNKRLNRYLYEYQISNNSNEVNNIYVNDQNILIDNYNNEINYFNDYVKNDILNNYETININNEIISSKYNVLLRKQRVLYEEKTDAVTTSEGASETLGDIRNKLKTRTETPDGITYGNRMYGPMKGKIDNLSNKPSEFRRTNNTEYETKLKGPPTNANDYRKNIMKEPDVKTKVINLRNCGVNKSRVVEYEVVPKIVTTKDEGNRKINRVEYEIRAKYDTTRKNEENNNDTTTNDISSKMETQNEYVMGNSNGTKDVRDPKMNITQQSRLNSKCNNMNGVKLNVPTSKETPIAKPSNNIENKEGKNPFIDDDVSNKKGNLQDNNRKLNVTTNSNNVKNNLGNNNNQMRQGTNPFIDDDANDKKDNFQDNNRKLNVTTNSTNDKNKLGNNNNQMKQGKNPFIDDDVNDKKDNLQDSNRVLKKGTNPFIDEDELEEILKQEREEKIRNEKKQNGGDNQNKKSSTKSQNKTINQNKQNSQNKPNKIDSQNVPNKQNIPNKLHNDYKENTQCNKNANLKKSDNQINEKSIMDTSKNNTVNKINNDGNNNSVKSSKFKDVLLDVAKDIENGISSDMLNKNHRLKNENKNQGKKLKSEFITQNELENKSARNMDDSKNLFEKGYDLKTESKRDFNISQESGLDYIHEYDRVLNKEYDNYSDRGSVSMEYDEYYDEYCDYDEYDDYNDYDDNYVGNPMKLFTSDIMNRYGNIKSGLKHNTNKIAKTVLKGIDDIDYEESSIKVNNKNKNNKKKDKIVIDKEDISDRVSLNSTDSERYYNNEDFYRNGNYYGSNHYYDSDMYSNSDDSDNDDGNPITVLASEIVDAYGNIKGGALKVKDLITEGGPQLLDMTANMVGNKTKDGLNKVKEIVSKKCGIDVESDIDLETETNPLKWHEVIRNKYRKLHFGWKLFLNIGPAAVLGIIGGVVAGVGTPALCSIPFLLMAGILFFQVYRLTKKLYYSKKKIGIKNLF
ncbi:EMP1-trafficking protein, putative [Plasmodium sp. gorilla clade G2]|uniref:EMP1-trafficking protein, putative n=1 Tax=Plasmodium sp. gorilla clade G2 TaxID=880535 RepID=UPI000D2CAFC5|nr:EMP1-trafficking protein, putative [Plasmodium sp. gorilla clade G2]SOV20010.1 EMP1-trafficking protein, putative [Plasmodium sp. gorilla clade G2]